MRYAMILLCLLFTVPAFAGPSVIPPDESRYALAERGRFIVAEKETGQVIYTALPLAAPTLQAEAPSSSIPSMVLGFLAEHWEYLLSMVLGLPFAGAWLTDKRKRALADAVYHAFWAVEDLRDDAELKSAPLDKAVKGLEIVNAYMVAHGWRPLKPGEEAAAKVAFKSMNAQLNAATDVPRAETSAVNPPRAPGL